MEIDTMTMNDGKIKVEIKSHVEIFSLADANLSKLMTTIRFLKMV